MRRSDWLSGLRTNLERAPRRKRRRRNRPKDRTRLGKFELLEDRRLLAVDFGDAPDTAIGVGPGNYNTLSTDNGPQHTIVVGLRMGANVDGDGGALQNAAANADDVNGALPDDEDGLVNPAADLVLTVGAQPTVNVLSSPDCENISRGCAREESEVMSTRIGQELLQSSISHCSRVRPGACSCGRV